MNRCSLPVPLPLSIRIAFLPPLLLSVCFSHAQIEQGQRSVSGNDARCHAVGGTVVNSVTGMPMPRALVELDTRFQRYTITDANGTFRFECIPEDPATLKAERPGFFKPTDLPSEKRGVIEFPQVSADVDNVVLKLIPWAEMRGYVRAVEGAPIQDLPIYLYQREIVDGGARWKMVASTTSDEEGNFRIYGLQKGLFIVSAGPEPWRPRPPREKHFGYPTVFYPNAQESGAASVIAISAGQQVEADFVLRQEELFEISGYVAGVPAAVDTKLELISNSGTRLPLTQQNPERHDFRGYVSSGRYTLRASAEVEGKILHATVPLTIASNTDSIQIVLAPCSSIPVKLRSERDFAPSRRLDTSSTSVKLISSNIPFRPLEFAATQIQNRNQDVMEIAGAEPGNYSVEINSYGAYVRSATSGPTDLLKETLIVPEDGRVAPIEILLSDDGGEVGGSVKLADRESTAIVLLVPERGSNREIRTAITERTGKFQFEQVRPGSYMLLAFDNVDDLEYKNPDVLSSHFASASHVSVQPRQFVTVNLESIHLGK